MATSVITQQERFWARVKLSRNCWLWTGTIWGNNHYGCVRYDGHSQSAHRVSWQIENGPIPTQMQVLHRCDTPLCVRPAHLFLGTPKDNSADMMAKGRWRNWHSDITHCKRGHAFSAENTRHDGRGRQCRACDVIRKSHRRRAA